MSLQRQDEFVRYNKILGKEASIGPIPTNQILPWVIILLLAYLVTNTFTNLGLGWFTGISVWWIASWWLLTGNKPYKFLDKWKKPPGKEWCNANKLYISPLPDQRPRRIRAKFGDEIARPRLKPQIVPNQKGGKDRFMPFQNEVNLCCFIEILKDDRKVYGYLNELGKDEFQITFMFEIEGIHDLLTQTEVDSYANALEEGLKFLPQNEQVTFFVGCYSDDLDRQNDLEQLANNCELAPVSVIVRNEQKRVRELSRKGSRQVWKQYVFCTWTAGSDGDGAKDWWSKTVRGMGKAKTAFLGNIAGNTRLYQEQFYQKLLLSAYQEGFLQYELLFNTKVGLNIRSVSKAEIWQWTWNRFNQGPAPEIPQLLTLEETETGYRIHETKTTEKHPVTVLIQGYAGESTTPQHQQSSDTITLRGLGKNKKCGVLVMEEPPAGWINAREQLRWLWKVMSSGFVRDTEAWVELTTANTFLIQDNLARQAKSSKAAKEVSAVKGQGRDVGAEIKQNESFEAQARLYEGAKALNCAPVFLVYRETQEQLDQACNMLANNFDTARVIREINIAWEIWLQTLPITAKRLLHSADLFSSERRLTPDTTTAAGFLPLTMPKSIDRQGVEFITDRGGMPIFIDLFPDGNAKRMLVTGTSGSGKSVMVWRFALHALAQGIPVVGMDVSSGGDSTFKTAVQLLGDDGACFDISRSHSNLMEPPDLRKFTDKKERERRMELWKDSILRSLAAITIGKIQDVHLIQRVDALLKIALKVFLEDPDIIERYNIGFAKGWKSEEWQQMPILKDFQRYCTRERLNMKTFEDLDRQALNQINTQLEALLTSRVGKAIGSPSSFSPEPAVKFFALSGLNNEQDAYLMAINAHAACIRTALSHPKSLFIGDELSVLLKKAGFASLIGETCATGRKEGIAAVLIGQDPDSFYECSAGSQILQNMNYRLTGRITAAAAMSFNKLMGYPMEVIVQNSTEAFLPRASELFSYWLIEKDSRFWKCRFYPSEMMLASVANNQEEQAARRRIMAKYPHTVAGRLAALKEFADAYAPAVKEGKGFSHIGRQVENIYQADLPAQQPNQEVHSNPSMHESDRTILEQCDRHAALNGSRH